MKRCGSRAWCSRTSSAALRATAPSSDRFARRISTSLTRRGSVIGRGVASPRISVDFKAPLLLAGAVSFWFGVALLCLGGGAAKEQPAETSRPSSDPEVETAETMDSGDEPPEPSFLALYAPAAIEGPGLRLPEPLTHLYIDGGYARTNDLSGLPLVAGSAHNYRFAAGGSLAWHRFSFDAEIAFSNITTIDVTQVPGGEPL